MKNITLTGAQAIIAIGGLWLLLLTIATVANYRAIMAIVEALSGVQ